MHISAKFSMDCEHPKHPIRDGMAVRFGFLIALVLLTATGSLCLGAVPLRLPEALRQILTGESGAEARILLHVRLPRTVAALLTGAALAASGAILQTVLNNTLAGPNIMGVNSGAGLFVLLSAALFPDRSDWIPAAAFLGALTAATLVTTVGARSSRITLILSGMAIGSILSAGSEAVSVLYPEVYLGTRAFFVGGLSGVTLRQILRACPYFLTGFLMTAGSWRMLDLLSLGEESARSLGLRVGAARLFLLAVASLLAGASVSLAGMLGFVGLMTPHIARLLFGSAHSALLPGSVLLGAWLTAGCDLTARLIAAPYELPVGILLSFLGGPFFLWLLLHRRGRLYA